MFYWTTRTRGLQWYIGVHHLMHWLRSWVNSQQEFTAIYLPIQTQLWHVIPRTKPSLLLPSGMTFVWEAKEKLLYFCSQHGSSQQGPTYSLGGFQTLQPLARAAYQAMHAHVSTSVSSLCSSLFTEHQRWRSWSPRDQVKKFAVPMTSRGWCLKCNIKNSTYHFSSYTTFKALSLHLQWAKGLKPGWKSGLFCQIWFYLFWHQQMGYFLTRPRCNHKLHAELCAFLFFNQVADFVFSSKENEHCWFRLSEIYFFFLLCGFSSVCASTLNIFCGRFVYFWDENLCQAILVFILFSFSTQILEVTHW